jgi:endoglucanase
VTAGSARAALVGLLAAGCVIPEIRTGGRSPSVRDVLADEAPVPNVLVDQVGYLPHLPKIATVKSAAPAPLDWQLADAAGKVVASGKTRVFGPDGASGDGVHLADFSAYGQSGNGFTLRVGADQSHPFDIRADLYRRMKYDALSFFYQNRSGIEIKKEHVPDEQWARKAGHLTDQSVPCVVRAACGYKLDVSGGWYDAGDHGKYVVNAGISVWTLLDMYERFTHLGRTAADFGDGRLELPERGNGVPDLLDEVRWEMEWMLKMQVPPGAPLAGMAHHKIHDRAWTSLAMPPHGDTQPRFLHPPSTAATLNLAANAAQAARVWRTIDPAFAARCLGAAEVAWQAARANPARYAPGGDTPGGGPYDDKNVDDEFYWAAAELYLTTGKADYRSFLASSPYYGSVPTDLGRGGRREQASAMTWQSTQALGTISMALVPSPPSPLTDKERSALRERIKIAADVFVAAIAAEGYRTPFRAGPKGYPWGSNSDVVNNLLVVALAGDITGDGRYPAAVATGFGYLLGRNPLDKSYVTGYGERPLVNPHHRFWSRQYNFHFPPPPPGVLSGGPNSGLQDPTIRAAGFKGRPPQKCFVDHIESWSSNEVAINWNAPFAWVVAYLDEQGQLASHGAGAR